MPLPIASLNKWGDFLPNTFAYKSKKNGVSVPTPLTKLTGAILIAYVAAKNAIKVAPSSTKNTESLLLKIEKLLIIFNLLFLWIKNKSINKKEDIVSPATPTPTETP